MTTLISKLVSKTNTRIFEMYSNSNITLRFVYVQTWKPTQAQAQSQQQILKINMPYPPIHITPSTIHIYSILYSLFSFHSFYSKCTVSQFIPCFICLYPQGIHFVCAISSLLYRFVSSFNGEIRISKNNNFLESWRKFQCVVGHLFTL